MSRLVIATVIYFIAVVFYLFCNKHDLMWAYIYSTINLYSFTIIWFGLIKPIKSNIEKTLLTSLMVSKVFSWLCYSIWIFLDCDWQNSPLFFCTIFVVILPIVLLLIDKKIIWR